MELLLFVGGLIGLDVLAVRYGRDSRPGFQSHEHALAELGQTWHGKPQADEVGRPPSPRRAHRVRHIVAGALFRLSEWVYPELNEPRRLPHSTTAM